MRLQVFSLRSVHKGFAGFGAVCLPMLLPGSQPCRRLAQHPNPAENQPQSLQVASPGAAICQPGEEEKGLGGVLLFNRDWLSCPAFPGHAKPRGCSEQPRPCAHPRWGRRGCCYHLSGGSTFPQLAKIKLLALQKEAGAGQSSSRLPCHPSARSAAEPAHPMAGYHGDPIPPCK